jgi:hypothetical protein
MSAPDQPPQIRHPWWVRTLLWGSSGRGGVMINVWVSFALTGICFVAGFWNRRLFIGTIFLLSALAYWAAIRWVDRNGGWADKK